MRSGRPPIDDRVTALQWNSAVHASPPSSNALTLHLPLSKRRPWLLPLSKRRPLVDAGMAGTPRWPFARRPLLYNPAGMGSRFTSPLCANATQSAKAAATHGATAPSAGRSSAGLGRRHSDAALHAG